MAQLFRPGAVTVARLVVLADVLFPVGAAALAYGLRVSPLRHGPERPVEQPVPFSA